MMAWSDQVPINEDHLEPITSEYIKKNMEKTFGNVEFLNGFIRRVFILIIFCQPIRTLKIESLLKTTKSLECNKYISFMRDTYQFYDNAMITAGLNDAESSKYLKKLFSAGMTWPGGLERNFSQEISKNKEVG